MSLTERCEKHELLGCGVCNPPAQHRGLGQGLPEFVWNARFDGTCMGCGLDILPGEPITRADGGAGYLHAACSD